MAGTTALSSAIVEQVLATDTTAILEPIKVGQGDWRNELVVFMKPENFMDKTPAQIAAITELMLGKIAAFDATIAGAAIVGGRALEELEIMDRHYGMINRLSRTASALGDEDKARIGQALGLDMAAADLLGGHEYLARYHGESIADLERLWAGGPSTKIRSGFYVRAVEKEGRPTVLVNAFHPEQLRHFTDPTHRIVLLLIHSNTGWYALKNEMGGATFPEKADPGSIRGTLYANPGAYGYESVSIVNNAVHLSAGPFEAAYECVNFFGNLAGLDVATQPPLALRRLIEQGVGKADAQRALDNPPVTKDGKATDLFTATEDTDTEEAVALYKASLS
jgi:hypothetical protein